MIGGTGKLGKALAGRLVRAGYSVIIGSRDSDKANNTALEIRSLCSQGTVAGTDLRTAASTAEIVILSIPFAAHYDTITELAPSLEGKLIIDVVVPLEPKARSIYTAPKFGSAALEARHILGRDARIVDAFQHIGAEHFYTSSNPDMDVLVCGSPVDARIEVLALVDQLGFHGVDAGPIENSVIIEGLTPLLIHMNKTYKKTGLGIKIQGL